MILFNKVKTCVESIILLVIISSCANDRIKEYNITNAHSDIQIKVQPFDKSAIKLLDGPLKCSVQLNGQQSSEALNLLNRNVLKGGKNSDNNDEIHSHYIFTLKAFSSIADYYECILLNFYPGICHYESMYTICQIMPDIVGVKDFQVLGGKSEGSFAGSDEAIHQEQTIYFGNNDELFVFQYIASELHWTDKNITIKQETTYPESQGTKFTFACQNYARFSFNFRHPYWCTSGFQVLVNGKVYKTGSKPGCYVSINRIWKNEDVLEIRIPFGLRIEEVPDSSNQIVIFSGPLILAGKMEDKSNKPVILSETRNPEPWVIPVEGKPNTYKTVGVGHPYDITLKPLYLCKNENYSIFWNIFTETTWKEHQQQLHARLE